MMDGIATTGSNPLTLENESFILLGKDVIDILGLECEVCTDPYDLNTRLPKLLPCKHTVCLPCLQMILESEGSCHSDDSGDHGMGCPICRTELHDQDLDTLPNDFRVVKGIEAIAKAKVSFRNVCFQHNCQKLDHFCARCVMPVCPDCIRLNHNEDDGHIIMGLTQALEENKERFDELERKCEDNLSQMKIRDTFIQSITRQLSTKEDDQIRRITRHFDEYIAMLNKRKEVLITKMQDKVQQRKFDLSSNASSLRESMNRLRELYENFRDSRESCDARRIFTVQKQFIDDEYYLLKTVSSNDDLGKTYQFIAINDERFKTGLMTTADVHTRYDVTMPGVNVINLFSNSN